MSQEKICVCPPQKRGWLGRVFQRVAASVGWSAGFGVGGFLAGHAGCVLTPVVLTATAATTVGTAASSLALAFSVAAASGGLYVWHRLRGAEAGRLEKALVLGSALSGFAVSASGPLMTVLGVETPQAAQAFAAAPAEDPAACPLHAKPPARSPQ